VTEPETPDEREEARRRIAGDDGGGPVEILRPADEQLADEIDRAERSALDHEQG